MNLPVVCIIGKPNVGKSTLFNKIVGQKISITEDTPGVTRDRINATATWLDRKFLLVDTGGLDPKDEDIFMKSIKEQADVAIDTSEVIIFLVDGIDGVSSVDRDIAKFLRVSGKKMSILFNALCQIYYYCRRLNKVFYFICHCPCGVCGNCKDKKLFICTCLFQVRTGINVGT